MVQFLRENPLSITLFIFLLLGILWSSLWFFVLAILIGIGLLMVQSWERIRIGKWDLDYIALLTLFVSFLQNEWLAGAIIALMVSLSRALETYGSRRAEASLEELFRLLPKTALVFRDQVWTEIPLQSIRIDEVLSVRHREMVPLDGMLKSANGIFSEANLTGEMEPVTYRSGQMLRSGIVNFGEAIEIQVTGDFEHSTYQSMLSIVSEGKKKPSPLVRLAGELNWPFTIITLVLSLGAYLITKDPERFLAVLVIATPCPLLIAAPIAFLGGLSKAAREKIIVKTPAALEGLARSKNIFFDKTGTLTLGIPKLQKIHVQTSEISESEALAFASALEEHSLHPLARALVQRNRALHGLDWNATKVEEKLGEGISGEIDEKRYQLRKATSSEGIAIDLSTNGRVLAQFIFDDVPKSDVEEVFHYLQERGFSLSVLTGDSKENAERILDRYHLPIIAECDPEKKMSVVEETKRNRGPVIMVGDGVNDAPALALADVGVVFSGTENSLSLEAADVVILERDLHRFQGLIHISRRSYQIAKQSMVIGIALSGVGMLAGAGGFLPPVTGAILQEFIDAVVIVNAVRAAYR